MKFLIEKLTPARTNDYLTFFDKTPHWDKIEEQKCYCVCWASADHRIQTDFSSAEKRRELAGQYIEKGMLQGYLAYDEDRVVGWCNANTKMDCTHCIAWLNYMQPVNDAMPDTVEKVKSVFCFVISPDMQRKGIATLLLDRVCADAAKDGFDFVEAYPKRDFISVSRNFMGPSEMYLKAGFHMIKELSDGETIMRKPLK